MAEPDPKPESPNAQAQARACGPTDTDPFDDMHDNQSDWDQYASLLPLRECCQIGDAFDDADKEAVKYQSRHRRLTRLAAGAATVAVMAAILGLGYAATSDLMRRLHPEDTLLKRILEALELDAAVIAVAVVGRGYRLRYKEKWLRFRHRAELHRLLRYNFLIQPSLWDSKETEQWIATHIQEIERLTPECDLEKALNEPSPRGPFEPTSLRMGRQRLQALTQYYLAKRLGPQKEYLANRAQRNEIKDWMRRYLPFFFFGSILAVGAKFLLKILLGHASPWWEFALILAAALLPVVAAGIRTYLASFEFSRNKSRFYAAHKALSDTEKSLVQNTFVAVAAEPRPTMRQESFFLESHIGQVIVVADQSAAEAKSEPDETDAYPVMRDLAWCEHILDAEHREWLRLMYDAEWFG